MFSDEPEDWMERYRLKCIRLEKDNKRLRKALAQYADPEGAYYVERMVVEQPPKTSHKIFKSVLAVSQLAKKTLEKR